MMAEPGDSRRNFGASPDSGLYRAGSPLCGTLAWFPFLLLFLPYPVASLVPVRTGLPFTYEWALPVFFTASLFCIIGLLSTVLPTAGRLRRAGWPLFLASLVLAFLSAWWASRFDLRETVILAGMVAIPLYFALCGRRLLPTALPYLFALLFGLHAAHGLWQIAVDFEVIGVTGNRNWMAALTISLAPFLPLSLGRCLRDRQNLRRWLYPLVLAGTVLLTALLLWHTRCRATLVALSAFGFWWVLWTLRGPRRRILFALAAAALILTVAWLNAGTLRRIAKDDIRLPCWRGTVAMIGDSPWLGSGPGQFRRTFPVYRTKAQKSRRLAADITEHPHNQFLLLAATGGIPFALLWLPLLLPLLAPPRRNREAQAIHFMTFMLVAQAMLDKQMVQPPTDLLACIGIGLVWRPQLERLRVNHPLHSLKGYTGRLRLALPLLALLPGLVLALYTDLPAGSARRRARQAEREGDFRRSVREYVRAAHLTQDARNYLMAGTAASQHLNQPLLSIKLLTWALQEEPYIGHLHRYLGLTMGRMGRHALALEHFELEAQLYPFDAGGHQLLFNARIHTGQFKGLPGLHRTIGTLRLRTVVNEYGETAVRRAVAAWQEAVLANQPRKAARIAHWILEALSADMLEPVSPLLMQPPADFRPSAAPAVTRQDYDLWRQWYTGDGEETPPEAAVIPVTTAEFRCRNQALAQIAASILPNFPLTTPPSPAARLEETFQTVGLTPSFQYRPPTRNDGETSP